MFCCAHIGYSLHAAIAANRPLLTACPKATLETTNPKPQTPNRSPSPAELTVEGGGAEVHHCRTAVRAGAGGVARFEEAH